MKKFVLALLLGLVIGVSIGPATVGAVEEYLKAVPSSHKMFLDGQPIQLEAYVINGNNYVKLADIGKALDFNVYWDGAVWIESDSHYTGKPSAQVTEADAVRQEIVQLVNQVRRENGVSYLTIDQRLMDAAQERAETLQTYHDTKAECEAAIAHGYPYGVGVNITAFTGTATSDAAQQAVTNWVNSPGHLQTMIHPDCNTIGVGFAEDSHKTVCYLFVGNPKAHNPYE